MYFRAQRVLIALVFSLAAGWIYLCATPAVSPWSWLWMTAPALAVACIMALEFTLLIRVDRRRGAQPPSVGVLFKAWLGELMASTRVFVWQQPFRSESWPDRCAGGCQGRTAVLLVHGFLCNRGIWNPWMKELTRAGVPFVALSLEPVFGSIGDYEDQIEAKVRELESATGRTPVLVAHSMGGLAARNWWARNGASRPNQETQPRLAHLITLASPHQGTWLARFGFSTNARQMRMGSRWIAELDRIETLTNRQRTTCYFSACDNVVFPREVATLQGADNRELHGVAHVAMVDHPEPLQQLLALVAKLDEPKGRP